MIRLLTILAIAFTLIAYAVDEMPANTTADYKRVNKSDFYRIVNHEDVTIYCDYKGKFITIKPKRKSVWLRTRTKSFNYRCSK